MRAVHYSKCHTTSKGHNSVLVLKDIALELFNRNEYFLTDIFHLILEVNQNGRIVDKTNLFPRQHGCGIWDSDQPLILPEVTGEFILSVSLQFDENDCQQVGSVQLDEDELYNMTTTQCGIPLLSHANSLDLILRTKVFTIQKKSILGMDLQASRSREIDTLEKIHSEGVTAYHEFQSRRNLERLEQAISKFEAAAAVIQEGDPKLPGILNNLGVCLRYRFEQFGRVEDINNSIQRLEAATHLTAVDDPTMPSHLNDIGSSLMTRFEWFGNIDDINSAIIHQRAAIDFTPDGHPDKPSRLNTLGGVLMTRFEWLGMVADIDSAISYQQAAASLTPDGHPDKPSRLNNLGSYLMSRFEWFGNADDINSAIIHQKAAINLTPYGHPDKSSRLNNLGTSLMTRFERVGKVADIDSAISYQQAAASLTPDGHPDKPSQLNILRGYLMNRFERFGKIADIDSAISHQRAALNLIPDGHPKKIGQLKTIGDTFKVRFLRFNDPKDAKAAILYFSASAQSPTRSPALRFDAVQQWISIASLIEDESLLSGYECALGLMPLVAWPGLPIKDRHEHLAQIGGIAREAAAAAISLEKYDKALEWLEQGRSVVWNQILQLRTPVDELHRVNPDLADRLVHVTRMLNRGIEPNGDVESVEEEGQRYQALTTEWESIIEHVRTLPNFRDFLKPLQASRLIDSSQNGPVVVVNIAEKRCDALAVVPGMDEVIHIPLPGITFQRVIELQVEFKNILYSSGMRMRGQRAAKRMEGDESDDCKLVLAELWNGLVKPVLDSLAFSPHPDVLPRIWWCATGPLAFLPIHAAGIYDVQSVDSQISDYVISSYVPTLSSLFQSASPSPNSPFKLLSVIQSSAPGASNIPNTKQELEYIRRHLGVREHTVLEGQEGTKERVKRAMEDSNWLHLACHGLQRLEEPTKSALLLEDGHLTLEEIIKLDLPKAEFAFLSACQTTTGEETLSDEAAHIAGGMLLAGYRGVVATMWSIQDALAPEVADKFYRHIMADEGRPDSRKAAEALHYSIQRLRQRGDIPLMSWIPFVHLGV